MDNILDLPAHKLIKLLKRKEISVEEVVLAQFKRIEEVERKIKSFVFLDREKALNEARGWDKKIRENKKIPFLCGIPIAIKDNICIKNKKTTCASRILRNFRPPYSATVIDKIKKAGCIIIGKTNMDEFAMGSSTEN